MIEGVIPARIEGETAKAYRAFVDYCEMGAARSLPKLYEHYQDKKRTESGPAHWLSTLKDWSRDNSWQERVAEYERRAAEQREQARQQKQIEIIDGALDDFDDMLDVWRKRWGIYKASGVGVTAMSLREMERMRRELDDFARRSVGLPDRVTESTLKGTGKGGEIELAVRDWHAIAEKNRQQWNGAEDD